MRNMVRNMVWFTLTTCVLMLLMLMSMLMSHTSLHLFVLSFALTCAYVAGEEQIMASQSLSGIFSSTFVLPVYGSKNSIFN